MRCPACGATNPDTAAWCGQCYRRFDEEPEAAPPPEQPEAAPPPADAPGSAPITPTPAGPPPEAGGASQAAGDAGAATTPGFRRSGDDLEWECPECGAFNGIELQNCAVCGTGFVERFRPHEPEPPRNWSQALLLSALAPGVGHLSVGRYGTGSARLLLFLAWVIGAILLATSAGSGGLMVAMPLLLGALALWVLTLVDVFRLQQGESEVLAGRTFLWLVVGVLVLMGLALFASVGTATAPAA